MRKYVPEVLLWLFVINLGLAFGAGIYESRVVVPRWMNMLPQTWPNTGLVDPAALAADRDPLLFVLAFR